MQSALTYEAQSWLFLSVCAYVYVCLYTCMWVGSACTHSNAFTYILDIYLIKLHTTRLAGSRARGPHYAAPGHTHQGCTPQRQLNCFGL